MNKKLIRAVIGLIVFFTATAGIAAPTHAALDNATRDGVVYIHWGGPFIDDDGEPALDSWHGTGFFIGSEDAQYIVTNYHVASGHINVDQVVKDYYTLWESVFGEDVIGAYQYSTRNAKSLFPLYVVYGKDDKEEAYVVAYDQEKDLAILKIDSATTKRKPLPLRKLSDDMVGDSFYAIGYPSVSDSAWDSVEYYGAKDTTVTSGTINRVITVSGTGTKIFQTDAKIRGGNSGGPLVDEQGNVVGINFQIMKDWFDTNLNYAICTDELIPLLNNNNVPYTLVEDVAANTTTETVSESTSETVSGTAAVTETTPTAESGVSMATVTEPAATEKPVNNENTKRPLTDYWWVLLIVLAVAAGVVCIVLINGRKKAIIPQPAPQPAPQPQPSPQPAPSNASAFLLCTKGIFEGSTFPINGSITIGRDPKSCQIIFPNETKGISSLHCEISVKPSGITLIDKGSTYGTFLAGGRKLNANQGVMLRSGDSFYLADMKNEFKVL